MIISDIGSYLPTGVIDNLARGRSFGRDDKFVKDRIGFTQRRVRAKGESLTDMCVAAFRDLQSKQAIALDDVGLVIVVTQSPDQTIPHSAALIHNQLGLGQDCMTFDVSQGCAGYIHGLAIARGLMQSRPGKTALLFTCDPYSAIVDPTDPATALIFGDAATVSILSNDVPGLRLVDSLFGTAPESAECLTCHDHFLMDGRQVLSHAIHNVPDAMRLLAVRHDLTIADIDFVALHQASRHAVDRIRDNLGLSNDNAPFEAQEIGNTVSSSIPLLLENRVHDPAFNRMMACGFGVGFTWGAGLFVSER